MITGETDYPGPEALRQAVKALSAEARFLDATDEAIRIGNPILGNIIMIGAVVGLAALPLDREIFGEVIREGMAPDRVEVNLRAFDIGVTAASPGNCATSSGNT